MSLTTRSPLKIAPPLEGWHGDNDEPIDHPWWLPVLSRVANLFANTPTSKEDLKPDLVPQYPLNLEVGPSAGTGVIEEDLIEAINPEAQRTKIDLPPPPQDDVQNS